MNPHDRKLKQAYESGYEKRSISGVYYLPMTYDTPTDRTLREEFNRGWKKRSAEIREGS